MSHVRLGGAVVVGVAWGGGGRGGGGGGSGGGSGEGGGALVCFNECVIYCRATRRVSTRAGGRAVRPLDSLMACKISETERL